MDERATLEALAGKPPSNRYRVSPTTYRKLSDDAAFIRWRDMPSFPTFIIDPQMPDNVVVEDASPETS